MCMRLFMRRFDENDDSEIEIRGMLFFSTFINNTTLSECISADIPTESECQFFINAQINSTKLNNNVLAEKNRTKANGKIKTLIKMKRNVKKIAFFSLLCNRQYYYNRFCRYIKLIVQKRYKYR